MPYTIEVIEEKRFASVLAEEIVTSLNEVIDEKSKASLVLAGGSTPSTIYRALARPPYNKDLNWNKVNLFWGDERFVPKDDPQSNFHMTYETLISDLKIPNANIFPFDTETEDPAKSAAIYQEQIIKQVASVNSIPKFDLVLLGIGEDGHTASLFPNSELLSKQTDAKNFVGHAKHPESGQDRLTLLPNILQNSERIYFMVKGHSKAEIIEEIFSGHKSAEQIPAKLFNNCDAQVTWFLDSAAAARLPK